MSTTARANSKSLSKHVCVCGCGEHPKIGRNYIHGHNARAMIREKGRPAHNKGKCKLSDSEVKEAYDRLKRVDLTCEELGASFGTVRKVLTRLGYKAHNQDSKIEDLKEKKFGRWLVIGPMKRDEKSKTDRVQWRCKCECGAHKWVRAKNLLRGSSRSCGCLHRELVSLPDGVAASNALFSAYKRGAKDRDLPFELSRKQFDEIIVRECAYCDLPPSNEFKSQFKTGGIVYNGIDRVENSLGYTPDNCVPCCSQCNRAKMGMSYGEFVEWIARVAKKTCASERIA